MTNTRTYGHIRDKEQIGTPHTFVMEHIESFLSKYAEKTHILSAIHKIKNKELPKEFNLLNIITIPASQEPYDQKTLGSCTANALAFAYVFDELKQHNTCTFMPSRLFIYYNERAMEGTIDEDAGAQIYDGISTLAKIGVCDEQSWAYDVDKFQTKPTDDCYQQSKRCISLEYKRVVQTLNQLKLSLLHGFPVVFGFTVYDSFESDTVASTGIVPMPTASDKLIGGHAVVCVGYDDEKQAFLVRNSWGVNWALGGYFYLPYDYMTDSKLASDFWTITKVSNPNFNNELPVSTADKIEKKTHVNILGDKTKH